MSLHGWKSHFAAEVQGDVLPFYFDVGFCNTQSWGDTGLWASWCSRSDCIICCVMCCGACGSQTLGAVGPCCQPKDALVLTEQGVPGHRAWDAREMIVLISFLYSIIRGLEASVFWIM